MDSGTLGGLGFKVFLFLLGFGGFCLVGVRAPGV